jgi:hypothetical protein
MQANSYSKYVLKDLHEAIDLFDRKIIYCQTHEEFDSSGARTAALQKLSAKRAALVKTALALTDLGVECDPRVLPRSFAQAAQEPHSEILPEIAKERTKKTARQPKAGR